MNEDESYLLGYTVGDGNLYSYTHKFALDNKNPNKSLRGYQIVWGDSDIMQLEIIKKIIESKFPGVLLKIRKSNAEAFRLRCQRKKVFMYLRELKSKKVENESDKNVSAFISGFFDAEGNADITLNRTLNEKKHMKSRIQATQKDRRILEKIQKLLKERFGIKSNIYKKWNQDAHVISMNGNKQSALFRKFVGFRNPTKNTKLDHNIASLCSKQL